MQNSNCKMPNETSNFKTLKKINPPILYAKEKTFQKPSQIYSQRKGENSSGGFGCKKAGGINLATLSKISKTNFK